MTERVPPQSPEIEEVVLGTVLFDPDSLDRVRGRIGSSDAFYVPRHRHVFEAMCNLSDANHRYDMILVENYLRDRKLLQQVGGSDFLADLSRHHVISDRIDEYVDVILDKYVLRQSILRANEVTKQAYEGDSDSEEVITLFASHADSLGKLRYTDRSGRVQDILTESLEDVENRMKNPGIHGVPSGFAFDKLTGGWQEGSLYIIGARPSIGKTALVLQSAYFASKYAGDKRTPVYYWNGEMLNKDMVKRLIAIESRINYIKMRDGRIDGNEFQRMVDASGRVYEAMLEFDDTPGIGVHALRSKYKAFVKRHSGRGMLCVDYMQLMSGHKEGNREQEISSIARALKQTALETATPVIALSQLSRQCLTRNYSKPSIGDLRESGAIEQDADGILLLNRPEFFGHETYNGKSTKGLGIVDVAKMRQGMTSEVEMRFNKSFAEWQNPEYETDHYNDREETEQRAPTPYTVPDIDFTDDDQPF